MTREEAIDRLINLRDDLRARTGQQGNPGWRAAYANDVMALNLILKELAEGNPPSWSPPMTEYSMCRRICTADNPWKREEGTEGGVSHPDAIEGEQMIGYPGGDVVQMHCPHCGTRWREELLPAEITAKIDALIDAAAIRGNADASNVLDLTPLFRMQAIARSALEAAIAKALAPAIPITTPTCPVERQIHDALVSAKISFKDGSETEQRLDFFLPANNLHIEVKQYHSPRIAEQMSRATDVIAIQGKRAASFFAKLLSGAAPPQDAELQEAVRRLEGDAAAFRDLAAKSDDHPSVKKAVYNRYADDLATVLRALSAAQASGRTDAEFERLLYTYTCSVRRYTDYCHGITGAIPTSEEQVGAARSAVIAEYNRAAAKVKELEQIIQVYKRKMNDHD